MCLFVSLYLRSIISKPNLEAAPIILVGRSCDHSVALLHSRYQRINEFKN